MDDYIRTTGADFNAHRRGGARSPRDVRDHRVRAANGREESRIHTVARDKHTARGAERICYICIIPHITPGEDSKRSAVAREEAGSGLAGVIRRLIAVQFLFATP